MKRLFDLVISLMALLILGIPMLLIAVLVKATSQGPVLYWSHRIGKNNTIYSMPKFRTMRIDTPTLPTQLLGELERHLTPIGGFLRNTSLDELPQLISILKGDMSLVGPRPVLATYTELVNSRTACGVHLLTPGLTGLAQINGRNRLSASEKLAYDVAYLERRSLQLDIKIVLTTFIKVLQQEGVNP